jgi:hypothetical protein
MLKSAKDFTDEDRKKEIIIAPGRIQIMQVPWIIYWAKIDQ